MKKCSHSHHHALAELNITPLLDLAFVLLVIFIITTTPVVNDLDVDLPTADDAAEGTEAEDQLRHGRENGKVFLNKEEVDSALVAGEAGRIAAGKPRPECRDPRRGENEISRTLSA